MRGRAALRLALAAAVLAACVPPGRAGPPEPGWRRHVMPIRDDLHLVAFANERVGYIVAHSTGRVLRTDDGGARWTLGPAVDSGYVEALLVAGRDSAWVGGERGRLYVTGDGGRTWARATGLDPAANVGVLLRAPGGGLWALTHQRSGGVMRYESRDGASWRVRDTLAVPNGIAAAGMITRDGALLVGGLRGIVRADGDGVRAGWRGEGPLMVRSLAGAGGGRVVAVGHEGLFLRSDDEGRGWTRPPPFTRNRLRDVLFTGGSTGIAVGDASAGPGSLFETRDGGHTWRADTIAVDLHRITRVRSAVWIVGKGGVVLSRTAR